MSNGWLVTKNLYKDESFKFNNFKYLNKRGLIDLMASFSPNKHGERALAISSKYKIHIKAPNYSDIFILIIEL